MAIHREARKLQAKLNELDEFYHWKVSDPDTTDRRFRVDVTFEFEDTHVTTCVWLNLNYTEEDLDLMIARAGSKIGMILADEHHHTATLSKKAPVKYLIATDGLEIEEIERERAREIYQERPVYVVCPTHDILRVDETFECPECD